MMRQSVYWLALLLPLVAVSQLFTGAALPDTADGIFHTHRIYAMTQLMQAGDRYPRWVSWFHLGYGYPVFNYYAPLGTWLGGLLGLLGMSAPLAFQLVTAASWLAGSAGMTALARRFLPDTAALAAAALWVYAPARMHEYWIQGSLSHVVATALVPFVFLTLVDLIRHPARREAIRFGVAVGLLILAHQPTTYLTGLYAAAGTTLALVIYRAKLPRIIMHIIPGLLVALGLSAVLLLPLLFEIDAIVINATPTGNIPAMLETNAIPLAELFIQPRPLDHTDLNATIPHTYGLLPGILALTGTAALLLRRCYALAGLLLAGAAASVFLATPASLGVWHHLPLMDQLRFPWRVLRVGIVPLSLLAAASVHLVPHRYIHYASTAMIALAILAALPILYPTGRAVDFTGQTAADMIRYEVASGAIGGTSYNEFRPAWGARAPNDPPDEIAAYETAPRRIDVVATPGIELERESDACWAVAVGSGGTLDFRQFYFPGWQATLDGRSLPVMAEATHGLLRVSVPETQGATLCLNYAGTGLQRLAGWITIITGGVTGGLWLAGSRRNTVHSTLSPGWAYAVGGALVAGALLNGLWIGPHTQWFRLQSPPDAPHYMDVTLDSTFAQGYDLLGYTLHDTTAEPGETLSVTLYWRPHPGAESTRYAPVVQFTNLRGSRAWASEEPLYIGSTPYNHIPQRFVSHRVDLTLFDDAPPFAGQVNIWLKDRQTDDWVAVVNTPADHITLPDVIPITGPTPPVQSNQQAYVIGGAVALVEADVQREGGELSIDLLWQIRQPLPEDEVKLFIHALDSAGDIVHQLDTALFSGDYPARYWQPNQTLLETYRLPDDAAIVALAIGLYTPETRLPVTLDGDNIPEGHVLLDVP